MTRSTQDIALSWALLYLAGLILTMTYLIIEGAIAAYVPLTVEVAGSVVIIALKVCATDRLRAARVCVCFATLRVRACLGLCVVERRPALRLLCLRAR